MYVSDITHPSLIRTLEGKAAHQQVRRNGIGCDWNLWQLCRPDAWLRRLACPIWIPDAFSQLRSVSIQIPSSLAASVGCRPCSVTKRAAPVLNSSSYRGGGVPFLAFFSSIFFAPFLFTLRLVSLSVNMAMEQFVYASILSSNVLQGRQMGVPPACSISCILENSLS